VIYELRGATRAAAKGEIKFCNYLLFRDVSNKPAVSTFKVMECNSATVNMEASCSSEKSELLIIHRRRRRRRRKHTHTKQKTNKNCH
jgi:hypothetical protein